jgi:hypothetical protein
MKISLLCLALLATPALADDPALRPSARLLFKYPEMLHSGRCVIYEEGGAGGILGEPRYSLKGQVVTAEVRTRHLAHCPLVPGKNLEQYTREEFIRQALAYPCVAADVPERDEQIGMVRLRVSEWETPHERKTANAGRLYRGMFIDRSLKEGLEIELEADLLSVCAD